MNRILYLDVVRIMACIMIVAMHAPIPNTGLSSVVLISDSLLTAPGIGLFIMVSGALLLPVKMSTSEFLKKRLGKVVIPTMVWTVIYWLAAPWTDTVSRGEGLRSFLSILFSTQFNGVLWFMYMLVGLYLLAPILSAWLQKATRHEVELYLGLWVVTLCYPLISDVIIVNTSTTGVLYYFGGYAGYFLLGYYLKRWGGMVAPWRSVLMILVPWCIATAVRFAAVEVAFYEVFWYLSLLTALASTGWMLLVRRCVPDYQQSSQFHRGIVLLSNCCFGIYLSHILVMRALLWHWYFVKQLDGILQIVIVSILTIAGSFAITWFISNLPFSEYIIGFKQRK